MAQLKIEVRANSLPSRYAIGTVVYFCPDMWRLRPEVADVMALKGRIDKVQFSGSKVTYDLAMECCDSDTKGNITGKYFYDAITVKDVDSCFVSTFEDIVEEWNRTVRITRENAERQMREASRRLTDLDKGIIIPDNWYLDATNEWKNPADDQGLEIAAPAPIEATAGNALEIIRTVFQEVLDKVQAYNRERAAKDFYDGLEELRVKWKEATDGCA